MSDDKNTETGIEESKVEVSRKDKFVRTFPQDWWQTKKGFLIGGAILIVLTGIGSGYFLATRKTVGGILRPGRRGQVSSKIKPGMEFGSKDTETFKDKAVGVVEKGGIDGEGSHKLIREGGPSQTAYLTSSIVKLDDFVDRKVEVWGETFAGQKAGWLLDVGRVKVLE